MKGKKYDYKEAYNTKLKPSARLHYLENARHDTDSPFNQGVIPSEDPKDMKPKPPPPTDAELYPERRGNQGVKRNTIEKVLPPTNAELYPERRGNQGVKKLEGGKHSPVKQVMDPSLAQQPQSLMSNVPPQQANTMGQAQPVFSPQTQQVAQGMFGSTQSMQNSVGATPLFQVQELPAVDLGTVKSDYKDKAFGLPFPGDKMYKGTDGFGKYGGKYTKEMTDANSNYTYQHNLANKPDYAEMKQKQMDTEASVVKTEDEGMSNMLQRQEAERRGIMEQTELSDRTELSED